MNLSGEGVKDNLITLSGFIEKHCNLVNIFQSLVPTWLMTCNLIKPCYIYYLYKNSIQTFEWTYVKEHIVCAFFNFGNDKTTYELLLNLDNYLEVHK